MSSYLYIYTHTYTGVYIYTYVYVYIYIYTGIIKDNMCVIQMVYIISISGWFQKLAFHLAIFRPRKDRPSLLAPHALGAVSWSRKGSPEQLIP